jgi:NADPH:quinone reductase-like Zn-dependent oxidoreductase
VQAICVERFGGPEVLALVEMATPQPLSTEVLVEVHAAGVNPVDCKTRRGEGVAGSIGSPPFALGWDVAGVVVATGYGVTRLRPGDRVFGMPHFPRAAGAYSEYVAAPSLQFARMPEQLDFVQASALPLGALTAWQSLFDAAQLRPGQSVLVHGATGGVGQLAAQLAAAGGASVVSTSRAEPLSELTTEVDVALDLVGGEGTAAALGKVRRGGILLAIADGADEATRQRAERRRVRVLEPLVEPDGRALDQIAAQVAAGKLEVAVREVFPLAAAADAHRRLERGGVRGKLVLEVGKSGT